MKYIQVKTEDGWQLIPAEEFVRPERKFPYVWSDLVAYQPMGGPEAQRFLTDRKHARLIDGRKQHRDFLRRNDFIEVGDQMKPADVAARGGKTQEHYDRNRKRSHKGHDLNKLAEEIPVTWSDPSERVTNGK